MQLVIDTNGVAVRARSGAFQVSGKEGKRTISPKMIHGICILSECLISSSAIRLAIQERIPILFFDAFGGASGRVWSAEFDRLPQIRRNQVLFECDRPGAAVWAAGLYRLKARGQTENLRFFEADPERLREAEALLSRFDPEIWRKIPDFEDKIMQLEAQVAAIYWDAVAELLPAGFGFQKRSRQPAEDMFNAALNYLYGMLYNTVEGAVFAAGMDPFLGVVHADEYNKPTLVFDLIEPFRAWIDRLLIELCRNEQILPRHFDFSEKAVTLNKEGKRLLIPAFESCMQNSLHWENREAGAKNHIYQYAGTFAEFLENYKPETLSLPR